MKLTFIFIISIIRKVYILSSPILYCDRARAPETKSVSQRASSGTRGKQMKSTTDVQKFVEHVEQMRAIPNEDDLYNYFEAARNTYGADSLMFEWIAAEYWNLVEVF